MPRLPNVQTGRKLEGVGNVMNNLNRALSHIANKSMKGLIKAAVLIRRDMDKTPPLIPVDLGNLRASSFIIAGTGEMHTDGKFVGDQSGRMGNDHSGAIARERGQTMGKKVVALGFSAYYAAVVEADTTTKRKRAGSGGGFFEGAIQRNKPLVIKVIEKDAKIRR